MQQHQPGIPPTYEDDFFAWTQNQARLLRAAQSRAADLAGIDLDHLAEEIEDLGKAELRSVTSLIRQIFVHLIKAASEKGERARAHWRAEAIAFQAELPGYYAPSMRQLIDLNDIWAKALRVAQARLEEQGAQLRAGMPTTCPYQLNDFLGEDFDFSRLLEQLNGIGKQK